ncbi:MAG: extracellular solute-binding protein [Thermoproteales archaeon]|nr:extracellular solute-binding protein [Thermoproteales archaeon]
MILKYYINDYPIEKIVETFNSINKKNIKTFQVKDVKDPEIVRIKGKKGLLEPHPFIVLGSFKGDILLLHSELLAQYADKKIIVPLDKYMHNSDRLSPEKWISSKYSNILDTVKYKGHIWGIPVDGDTYSLFCNLTLFQENGIDYLPSTWSEVLDISRKIYNGIDRYGFQECSFQFPLQIWQAGGEMLHINEKSVFEALKYYYLLHKYRPPHASFERNDFGMKISVIDNISRYISHKINFKTTTLPKGKIRANSFGHSRGILAFAIVKNTRKRERNSWNFIEWFFEKENYFQFISKTYRIPLLKETFKNKWYNDFIQKNPLIKPFVDDIKYAKTRPCIPEYRYIAWILREILLPIQRAKKELNDIDIKRILKKYIYEWKKIIKNIEDNSQYIKSR